MAAADEVGTSSDGAGTLGSGDATAVGNTSGSSTNQGVAPSAGSSNPTVVTQTAIVPNVGIAVANTGGNVAVGNSSTNTTTGNAQNATGGAIATSNSGEVANVSDGSASIVTGAAAASGNQSRTTLDQSASGALGIITSQNALVLNAGVAVANTGLNGATGNTSTNTAGFVQNATNTTGLAANAGTLTNASNGVATISTGSATATGNKSETWLDQTAGGTGDDDPGGLLVINQLGIVANLGAGIANTGLNAATGNASGALLDLLIQDSTIGDDTVAPLTVASNQLDATSGSDGSASIHTGTAAAVGNDSSTNLTQASWGDPDQLGAIVATQNAAVGNVGLGVANTGVNLAAANVSQSFTDSTENVDADADPLTALLPVTATNSLALDNHASGTARIRTGDTSATGNDSETVVDQASTATVEPGALGVLPNTQTALVLDTGAGIANSGINAAVGNASGTQVTDNFAAASQTTVVGNQLQPLTVAGPVTADNAAEVSQRSDGTAEVRTGAATASGNTSGTVVDQDLGATVAGMGLVVAPQTGIVVNAGAGIANSGVNAAIGNVSTNNVALIAASAHVQPSGPLAIVGPLTVGDAHSVSNRSDGQAVVATGAATASGNRSRSTLAQDLDLTADDGIQVVPTTGIVLNAGFGLANSGVNLAIGNLSDNTASALQAATLDPNAPSPLVGPQTVVNGGALGNASRGGAVVGSGRATATGNLSDSSMVQAAAIDGTGVVAPITGGIGNIGAGAASSGVNLGVGNASTNEARTNQGALGTGTVANQVDLANSSDGTATINVPVGDERTPEAPPAEPGPGGPTLPRTGGAIETMAAVALLLLLAGFAAHGLSRRYAA